MFRNVLIGVDERPAGRDAIALAERLVAQDGLLTLAHVYAGDTRAWRGSNPDYDAVSHEQSLALLAKARDDAGIIAKLRCIGASSAGHGLHLLAQDIEADLLVVGSSARGLLGRVLLGDDTHAALGGAPSAVAIAPAGYAQQPGIMREVGVGFDGSAESEQALRFARRLAAEHGAKLSAFEAVSLPSYALIGGPAPLHEAIEAMVADARERVSALDGVEPHAAYGHPAEELALYSASLDLLVVGSRSYGPLGRLVHGSTSHQLSRSARCPLLVLPRASRVPTESAATNGPVATPVAH